MIIILILLVLLCCGAFPRWGYNQHWVADSSWGYAPFGGLGLVVLILVILLLLGRI